MTPLGLRLRDPSHGYEGEAVSAMTGSVWLASQGLKYRTLRATQA